MPALRSHQEIAAQIARSAATGDPSLFREVLAPDAIWWHSIGDRTASVEVSLASFQAVLDVTHGMHYEDVRITPTQSGYVDQHYVVAHMLDGTPISIPAVMVATVVDGVITRLDEYVEALAAAPIAAALSDREIAQGR